jgi:hypothetical protein
VLRVLVDADNVRAGRVQPVLTLLRAVTGDLRLTAGGSRRALDALCWPRNSELLPHEGWQRADLALAESYDPAAEPLILISGDGDFALLAARHPGAVLVVSGAPSGRFRDTTTLVDPAIEGVLPVEQWLAANGIMLRADHAAAGSGDGVTPADVVLEQQAADREQDG